MVGSLRNRATEEYDRLPDDAHRTTMQRVMLRMVATEGGDLARRRVALSELAVPDRGGERPRPDRARPAGGRPPAGPRHQLRIPMARKAKPTSSRRTMPWCWPGTSCCAGRRRLRSTCPCSAGWRRRRPNGARRTPRAKSGLLWDDDPRLPQVEKTLWPAGGRQNGPRGPFTLGAAGIGPEDGRAGGHEMVESCRARIHSEPAFPGAQAPSGASSGSPRP